MFAIMILLDQLMKIKLPAFFYYIVLGLSFVTIVLYYKPKKIMK